LFVQAVIALTFVSMRKRDVSPTMFVLTAHFQRLATVALLVAFGGYVAAQTTAKPSPFLPPAGANAPAASSASTYELAGMSVAGKATLLSIVRVRDKRSIWVPVGQSVGEITAVSFDPQTDQATIRADGQLLTLSMRKSAVVSGPVARMPAAQPVQMAQPVRVAPPVAIPKLPANADEEKETEARMLVTDLLEIGQEQRRAYEEAQKQAASKGQKPGSPSKAAGSR
jgi:hypothetical protein